MRNLYTNLHNLFDVTFCFRVFDLEAIFCYNIKVAAGLKLVRTIPVLKMRGLYGL